MTVKLTLRNMEYQVKGGMTLRSSLLKIDIQPETVLATLRGELITDDEVLKDGEVVQLISVISGGSTPNEM